MNLWTYLAGIPDVSTPGDLRVGADGTRQYGFDVGVLATSSQP
jgi:hypothetical protein